MRYHRVVRNTPALLDRSASPLLKSKTANLDTGLCMAPVAVLTSARRASPSAPQHTCISLPLHHCERERFGSHTKTTSPSFIGLDLTPFHSR